MSIEFSLLNWLFVLAQNLVAFFMFGMIVFMVFWFIGYAVNHYNLDEPFKDLWNDYKSIIKTQVLYSVVFGLVIATFMGVFGTYGPRVTITDTNQERTRYLDKVDNHEPTELVPFVNERDILKDAMPDSTEELKDAFRKFEERTQ